MDYSIRERVGLLVSNAKNPILQLEAQGIQMSATVNYGTAEVYVGKSYGNSGLQVRIDCKEEP
jgi:hypothetical protein